MACYWVSKWYASKQIPIQIEALEFWGQNQESAKKGVLQKFVPGIGIILCIDSVQLSSMGTLPFFVENVSLLQLSALRLVRAVSLPACIHTSDFKTFLLLRFSPAMKSTGILFLRIYLRPCKDCQPTNGTLGATSA